MTTILVDLEEKVLYSDSRVTTEMTFRTKGIFLSSDVSYEDNATKMHKVSDDVILAGAGATELYTYVVEYYKKYNNLPDKLQGITKDRTLTIFAMTKEEVYVYTYRSKFTLPFINKCTKRLVKLDFYKGNRWAAIESGARYLKTVIRKTDNPYHIMKVSEMMDRYTGGEIKCMSFDKENK